MEGIKADSHICKTGTLFLMSLAGFECTNFQQKIFHQARADECLKPKISTFIVVKKWIFLFVIVHNEIFVEIWYI